MKKIFFITVGLVLTLVVVWSVGQRVYLGNIEKPEYQVVQEEEGYEIRQYSAYIVASTNMKSGEDDTGFMSIAGYIFGDNTKGDSSEEIAMTSPVIVVEQKEFEEIAMTSPVLIGGKGVAEGAEERMSFVLPSKYSLDTLPIPNNKDVFLEEIPEKKWAVLEYSWSRSEKLREEKKEDLLELLVKDGYEVLDEVQFAFYDPPTTLPFLLHNEVWIRVK